MTSLFDPITVAGKTCPNRIFMAPLTRGRGTRDHVPTSVMAKYYAQRSGAGIIISEAIGISRQGLGWPYATGLWRKDQILGWRRVTDAVHTAGGTIFAQIWHMGRMVHPSFTDGAQPVSSSPTQSPGRAHIYGGRALHSIAREASVEELKGELLLDHVSAAKNAIEAGFDGVQIHAANGYLIDQFLRNGVNHRMDSYGGSIENRLRFLKEVTAAVTEEIGNERTAVRLSPNGDAQGVNDSAPELLFSEAANMLDSFDLAFLEVRDTPRTGTLFKGDRDPIAPLMRKGFRGVFVVNSDLTHTSAQNLLSDGLADAVSFGRDFIANPDLPRRLQEKMVLSQYDKSTIYGRGEAGYTDYPLLR